MNICKEYYVYVAKVSGEVVYVGSGKEDRYLHVTSGKSHNGGLNFIHRQGTDVDVEIVRNALTKIEARAHEQDLIDLYTPAFNKGVAASKSTRDGVKRLAEIRQESDEFAPSREVLALARRFFHAAFIRDYYEFIQMAFELSRARTDGKITYTQSQLDEFIAANAPKFKGNTNCRKCLEVIHGEKIFRATVADITEMFGHEDSFCEDWAFHIRYILRNYDRVHAKYMLERNQMCLF